MGSSAWKTSEDELDVHSVSVPLINGPDPRLDPTSTQFEPTAWFNAVRAIRQSAPHRYPAKPLGLCFKDLNAHGTRATNDYQQTFGNYPLRPFHLISGAIAHRNKRVQILHSIDGVVNPGEMLLVLGRPGSGVSTLLKTIAGDTHGFVLGQDSHVNYRGIPADTMHDDLRGYCIYTAETDVHFPELTVSETLDFAVRARVSQNPLPGMTQEQQAEHFLEVLLTLFNLRGARDTKLGNEFIRGVSGGEKKRVSIAEALASWSPLQCWDNSTRGLDSGTALSFVRTLRHVATSCETSILMSVYQASEAIYEVFDKVTVLYEGQQIFFGPCSEAKDYFVEMGFECPANATTPDFLSSLTHPAEAKSLVRPGFRNRVPRNADEFRTAWLLSEHRQRLLEQMTRYDVEFPLKGPHLAAFENANAIEKFSFRSRSPYLTSVFWQIRICMKRHSQRLKNNLGVHIGAVVGNSCMGLIVGSMFYNLDTTTDSFYNRGVLVFFSMMLNAFMTSFEVLSIWAQRPIVEKHTQYAWYHPCVEAIASTIGELPFKVLASIMFNLALYFLTNLRRDVSAFFTYWLFALLILITMSMFFRMIGSLSRTLAQTMAPVSMFMVNYIIYTGYVLPDRYMHPWLKWIKYINPIGYAFESAMINEFSGIKFPCATYIPDGPAYESLDPSRRTCSAIGSVAGQNWVEGSTYIGLSYSFKDSHLWRNLTIIIAIMMIFLVIYLFAAEYIRPQRSKGEVLLFRRGKTSTSTHSDEEAPMAEKAATNVADQSFVPSGIQSRGSIVHWEDVSYHIKTKEGEKQILTNVSGWVRPGTLTALMGITGAGKTTLLDVLANRASIGIVTGDIMVNGHARHNSFQRKTGYVQQQDIHLATATVRETLNFSALLRQPAEFSRAEKLAYVDEVIKALEMEGYADAVVGNVGESLNVEQRKRLTIAVEMVAKPELLLFLDEPTSGLDSQTAWSICMLLRKLVAHGQAIMCTVHQPSAVLLGLFDQLLLLESPGKTIYFGPLGQNSETMINYFEKNGARPIRYRENPADWVFEVTKAGADDVSEWGTKWDQSPEQRVLVCELQAIKTNADGPEVKTDSAGEYAMPLTSQLREVVVRMSQEHWRTPTYFWPMFTLCSGMAFFIGFSFWDSPSNIQGLTNQIFSIFLVLTILTNIQIILIPKFAERRTMYEAVESRSKTYSWKVLVLSHILVEIPWLLLISASIFALWYYPVGMYKQAAGSDQNERGALMFLCLWMYMMFGSTFAAAMAAGMEHAQTAVEIIQLLYYLLLIFCGILVKATDLPRFWIFMYRISPLTYLASAMMSAGIANAPVNCSPLEIVHVSLPSNVSCAEFLAPYRSYTGATILHGQD